MRKIFLSLITFAFISVFSGCIEIPEDISLGGSGIPYGKLALNMFPRDETIGSATSQMRDVKSLGMSSARVNFWFDTLYMPTSSSPPSFARFDTVANAADTAGIELLVILGPVPNWLIGSANWKSVFVNSFVVPVVTRYRGRIKYWEVWNEPDLPFPDSSFDVLDGSPDDYFDLLQMVSNAIRSIDSDAKIVSGATANIVLDGLAKFEWTQSLIDMGLAQYADILNIHYYSETDVELQFVGGPLVKNAGMPVWVTETGKNGHSNHLSYFETAIPYIDQSLAPERIFWYSYFIGDGQGDGIDPEQTKGLVTIWNGSRVESPLYTHLKNR